jgi:hypothetical protein
MCVRNFASKNVIRYNSWLEPEMSVTSVFPAYRTGFLPVTGHWVTGKGAYNHVLYWFLSRQASIKKRFF